MATWGAFDEIPVIDVGQDGPDMAAAIGRACREVGFFYATNHGIDGALWDAIFRETMGFFARPEDEKMPLYIGAGATAYGGGYVPLGGEVTNGLRDWHEAMDFRPSVAPDGTTGSPFARAAPWLAANPDFAAAMRGAWDAYAALGHRIVAAMASSLGLPADHFAPDFKHPLAILRLLNYPLPPATGAQDVQAGIGAHCDYGFLTMVAQDETGGLEVRNARGNWIAAPPRPRTLIVNIGTMVQRWTNDRYRATWHRVRMSRSRPRYSVAFFFEPGHNTVVRPLDVCCGPENPPRYEPCHFGEFIAEKFANNFRRDFAGRGKQYAGGPTAETPTPPEPVG